MATPVNNTNPADPVAAALAAGAAKKDNSTMGKDDFLKLLVAPLKHQDPMAPSTDQEWIGQITQFSQLEQETNTAASTVQIAEQLGRTGALGLIGRTVTYEDADGNPVTGVVQQVNLGDGGKATLTIGGKGGIDAATVTEVK